MNARLATCVASALALACAGDQPTQAGNPPAAPASISAAVQANNILITWTDVPGATRYNVYMAAVGGVKRINYATLTGNMFHPNLSDKFDHPPGLDPNILYYFVVTALNDDGESPESCEVTAKIADGTGGTC
ncbi:MAG: fibronectin type III domain-containing protein [Gemmatimonadota bacterium]|nr:fibronectin type III domain-containing protein [Gemmatimonadota bacterium]